LVLHFEWEKNIEDRQELKKCEASWSTSTTAGRTLGQKGIKTILLFPYGHIKLLKAVAIL